MITVYSMKQGEEWDRIVQSFSDFDVYYLSGYVRAFELHGDGVPLLLYYETDSLRGISVVMKRDVALDNHFAGVIAANKYFDLTTPYGYGGWLFEGDSGESANQEFQREYTSWCQQNGIVSEFVRFHPALENAAGINRTTYEVIFLGNTVSIELDDQEAIWQRYSSKNRGHIRVAAKEGVTVKNETTKEAIDTFRQIYAQPMDHDDAKSYYYFDLDFFESIRNDLKGHYGVFTAYLEDKAIASAIMLYAGKYMNYHLSGQLFEYRRYAGTNMILHEAAKWGCEHGFTWLHLGGGLGAQEGSLYDFKKSFYKKGEDKCFYIGKRIWNQKHYDELMNLRDLQSSTNFFPGYRAD